ncbi:MAG: enoyl-ACP reductase [Acidobacteria bacterium]|uniref:Enoyl-[acyl-carrier-protein] reductase [NADH] n=1 Tax=Candidatus Polarisedimenticola svalbardensis TaxID=2886004 RepID=A0A8J7C2D3_9BACT|nr:enoyl-ACP reductase [Candidatus Polarisedimenticola svalbardensis]
MRSINLRGKTALVLGVANKRSLAWAIAEALGEAGCRLAMTYQGERLQKNVSELAAKHKNSLMMALDVTSEEQADGVFAAVKSRFGRLDYLIHSIAFARREDLEGEFRKTSRDGWRIALDISAFSLVSLSNRAAPLMTEGGSILSLTFQASQRVFPNYNVMGAAKAALEYSTRQLAFELGPKNIRVNTISAGPVPTLSARGISGFSGMSAHHRKKSPLQRNIEPREVGDTALFLCSDMGSGITGATIYVDAGYHIIGL